MISLVPISLNIPVIERGSTVPGGVLDGVLLAVIDAVLLGVCDTVLLGVRDAVILTVFDGV